MYYKIDIRIVDPYWLRKYYIYIYNMKVELKSIVYIT